MTRRPSTRAWMALGLMPALLSACALMHESKPFTTFQFGTRPAQAADSSFAARQPVVIVYAGSTFDRQSSGDRILTTAGSEVSYVADARWIAPAEELFDAAAVRDIEALSPQIRVIRAGAPTKGDYLLGIDVRQFEASYAAGPESAPEVIVTARVKLMRVADRTIVGDWTVAQRENAQENRIGAIVAAFDGAAAAVTSQIASDMRAVLAAG